MSSVLTASSETTVTLQCRGVKLDKQSHDDVRFAMTVEVLQIARHAGMKQVATHTSYKSASTLVARTVGVFQLNCHKDCCSFATPDTGATPDAFLLSLGTNVGT